MRCYSSLSGGLTFLRKAPTRASRSRLSPRKAADSCPRSWALQPRRCLQPREESRRVPTEELHLAGWGRAKRHTSILSQRRGKGMYPPEKDPGPQTIGNGIQRKPFSMFPYWQKRKISLPPLAADHTSLASSALSAQTFPWANSMLWASREASKCSAGLNWLTGGSTKQHSQSKEQQGDSRSGTERQERREKNRTSPFSSGLALPDPSGENTASLGAEGIRLLSVCSVWKGLVGETRCFLLPPFLPRVTHHLATPICLIHCLRTQKKSLPSAKI